MSELHVLCSAWYNRVMKAKAKQSFNWLILQDGALHLRPDGSTHQETEHVCTSVLIWPETEEPGGENTLLTDPCFTMRGLEQARERLDSVGLALEETRRVFITHAGHWDHEPMVLKAFFEIAYLLNSGP